MLGSHIEEEDSEDPGQTPSMDSAIAGILETVEEAASFALREMAGTAIKDGLQELVTNLQTRESAAEVERQDDRRQSLTRMDAQVASLEAAWKAMSDATGNVDDAETDASIAAYESHRIVVPVPQCTSIL